jgi:S1-C subfamily serine protease
MKRIFLVITALLGIAAQAAIEKNGEHQVPEKKADEAEAGKLLDNILDNLLGGGGDRKNDVRMNNHFRELLDGHQPGSEAAAKATYVLRDGAKAGRPLGFATGVHPNGWLITKASEVAAVKQLQIEVRGKWISAKVSKVWGDHDLALLKTETTDLGVAQWSALPSPEIGTFITAAAPTGRDAIAIGVVSVAARNIRREGRGFLGVQIEADDKGLKVGRVVEKSAAEKAGLKASDRIVELDGKKPESVFAFTKTISNKKAGDNVRLKIQRGEAFVEKEISLGDLASVGAPRSSKREERMTSMGSTISKRRDNFPNVIQTDFPLDASQCGGPVTDLDGNVVGIVIARAGRIETLVLPSEAITSALKEVDFSR